MTNEERDERDLNIAINEWKYRVSHLDNKSLKKLTEIFEKIGPFTIAEHILELHKKWMIGGMDE